MSPQETPSVVVLFVPLTNERVSPKVWAAAAFLAVLFIGVGSMLLMYGGVAVAAEKRDGFQIVGSHEIVELVRTVVLQHSDDKQLSKQIADKLSQEDHRGEFQSVQTPQELANLLTERVREVSQDSRYQVLYSAAPPDIAEAHGRAMYRITQHIIVALPSP
jgi:hypothetical protein